MFENLPDELLALCFSFTEAYERQGIFSSCTRFNHICFSDIPANFLPVTLSVSFCKEFKYRKEIIRDLMKGNLRNFSFDCDYYSTLLQITYTDSRQRIEKIQISEKTHQKFVELFLLNYKIDSEEIEFSFRSSCFDSLEKSFDILMNASVSSAKWFDKFVKSNFNVIAMRKNRHIIRAISNSGKVTEKRYTYAIDEVLMGEEDLDFTRFLLSLKPEMNVHYCSNALKEAVCYNMPEIVQLLLDHGAEIETSYQCADSTVRTQSALNFAVCYDQFEIAKVLVEHGADINLCDDRLFGKEQIAHYLMDCGLDVTNRSMFWACRKGLISVVERMISLGANVNTKDANRSSLDGLFRPITFRDLPILEICKLLFANGAKIENGNANTAGILHRVCLLGNMELIKLFVSHGADFNMKSDKCNPPIFGAIETGNLEVIKFLIENLHVDINITNVSNETPVQYAAKIGMVEISDYLSNILKRQLIE